jgi:hypothetical protein
VMQLDHLSTHQVHHVARFSAAAAAAAQGFSVEVVGARTRLEVAGKVVQVLSRRQPGSPWQTKADSPTIDDATAVIFVDLTGEVPDFFVAPAAWVVVLRKSDCAFRHAGGGAMVTRHLTCGVSWPRIGTRADLQRSSSGSHGANFGPRCTWLGTPRPHVRVGALGGSVAAASGLRPAAGFRRRRAGLSC